MKKIIIPILFLFLSFQACKDIENVSPQKTTSEDINKKQITFAKTLAKALKNELGLRIILKEEALKEFDKDYDVLYQMIKNKLVRENKTVSELLKDYAENAQEFELIESTLPLLTIFVPELPDFSAQKWNVNQDIPAVAVGLVKDNNIPVFDFSGKLIDIPNGAIPAFPVITVKQNERVSLNNNKSNAKSFHKNEQFDFIFIDEAFNNINNNQKRTGIITPTSIDPRNVEAYYAGVEWQRDYIYYGLTPNNPIGKFKNNYSEFITSFKFLDVSAALNKISDQQGEVYKFFAPTNVFLLEGNYEFRVSIIINSKNGLGNQITKIFSAKTSDLLGFKLKRSAIGFYYVESVFGKEYNPNIEILPWDLQNYGTAWKFIFYEYDLDQEITETFENTSTFAVNFGYDATFEDSVKQGVKFGASAGVTERRVYSVKTTLTSDFLGEATLTFDQPVITNIQNSSTGNIFTTREITTGNLVSISVEPKKVF
jgi:hypothetical protein